MLSGPSGLDLTKLRVNGFKDYLAKYPGMKVVVEKFSSTASSEALTVIQDFLQAHPDLKVVYAFNGPIAIGAVQALRAAGKKPGEVMVLTTDMEVETRRLINDGWIQATVVSQPVTMAELAVQRAVEAAEGKKIPKETLTQASLISKNTVDAVAITLVDPGIEQRIGQDIEGEVAVDASFPHQRQNLAHAFESCCGKDVGGKLDEICRSGVFADHEQTLTEALEERPRLMHRSGWSGGEYEELPCPGKIRVPQDRCCDIALAVPRMLLGDAARHFRADGARGNVNGPRFENGCQTLWTERDLSERVVVGQRRQHDIASGKIAEPRGGGSADHGRCSLWVPVVDAHLITVCNKIGGKGVAHVAQTDHADT